ncbi:hypothetical protein CDN99_21910 [Roseateles aquatilis]|uniref:Uncharacterized protein n=1 Tax=Roseateles aquatilis TaxID=431061 RepID=A0A246IZG4_9BURK|nr:hypothetical protein [Roseateles aquatilis]OWQ85733.1 hypothetical protein CDN99_21910 [Roseateles aquatilis]
MTHHRITVACEGLTDVEGTAAVADVLDEFKARPWHIDISCVWSNGRLTLSASNDYDAGGMALLDEFGDAIHACVDYSNRIKLAVVAVEEEP